MSGGMSVHCAALIHRKVCIEETKQHLGHFFWEHLLWTDEVKIDLFDLNQLCLGKERNHMVKRTSCQMLIMEVEIFYFGVM